MPNEPLIPLSALTWTGEGLSRPECVITTAKGEIFVGDHECGIAEIGKPKRKLIGAPPGFLPNGVTMLPNREFLLANLGPGGGVWRLDKDWRLWPWLFEAEGEALRVCNFVGYERDGTVYISVSTRQYPRERAMRPVVSDGFIVRVDGKGARMVADGIGFTNECRVDPTGKWLYVNETIARRTSRFEIRGDALGPREVVHEFGPGEFPDGFAFDAEGGVWVACVLSNRVIRIDAERKAHLIIDDSDAAMIERSEAMLAERKGGSREWLEAGATRSLRNIASVSFGGPDLKTVYLGCLKGDRLPTFRSPIAGAEPVAWRF